MLQYVAGDPGAPKPPFWNCGRLFQAHLMHDMECERSVDPLTKNKSKIALPVLQTSSYCDTRHTDFERDRILNLMSQEAIAVP